MQSSENAENTHTCGSDSTPLNAVQRLMTLARIPPSPPFLTRLTANNLQNREKNLVPFCDRPQIRKVRDFKALQIGVGSHRRFDEVVLILSVDIEH